MLNALHPGKINETTKATQAEAVAGADNRKYMTPLRTKQVVDVVVDDVVEGALPAAIDTALAAASPVFDDVLSVASVEALPNPGVAGKLYIVGQLAFHWNGTGYDQLGVASSDEVPEGTTNLYFTEARAAATAPVQSVAGKAGAVTLAKADVGLGNVDNTSDLNKPISTATQAALDEKAASGLDQSGQVQKALELTDLGTELPTLRLSNDQVFVAESYRANFRTAIGAASQTGLDNTNTDFELRAEGLENRLDTIEGVDLPALGQRIDGKADSDHGHDFYAQIRDAVREDSTQLREDIFAASAEHTHTTADLTDAGNPNGVATLDSTGKLPATQLPDLAISDFLGNVADQAAMLTKTGQKGDWVTRADDGKVYVITGDTPSQAASWTALSYPAAPVSSVAGKAGAVDLYLEDLTNFASLAASAYKLAPFSHEVTSASSLGLSSVSGRAQAWTITFRAAVAYDFFLPATVTVMGQVMHGPQLGDIVTINFLTTGQNSTPWTARFKRSDLSTFLTVTSADSDLKKSNIRFVYDGTAWELDRATWHQHAYSEILNTPPDVATGYFDRAGDAINRGGFMGQAPYQVVLANDTRLIDPRRTAWVTPAPASPTTIASGLQLGAQAYDGSFLYTLVPMPGGQTMRWARIAMSTTW